MPFRGMVRISLWSLPLSPIAFRAALMRLSSVEFRHDPATPDQGNEIVPADDVIAVLQQMNQQVEYLRLHRHQVHHLGAARDDPYQG